MTNATSKARSIRLPSIIREALETLAIVAFFMIFGLGWAALEASAGRPAPNPHVLRADARVPEVHVVGAEADPYPASGGASFDESRHEPRHDPHQREDDAWGFGR